MKLILAFIYFFFLIGCSNNVAIRYGEKDHRIKILDNLAQSEGKMVASFVASKMDELRMEYLSVDANFTHLVSISRWHTPGMPTDEDKMCKYSANFYYGGFGNQVCIGVDEVSEEGTQLKVLGSAIWIS